MAKTPFSSFSLTLAGPIESDPSIFRLLSNLPSNISLQDSIPSNDIPDWLSGFDILITFSRGESIGSATLEALLCGKPVISSLNSGSCQVLRHSVDSYLLDDLDPAPPLFCFFPESLFVGTMIPHLSLVFELFQSH